MMNAIECLLDISVFLDKPSPIPQSDVEITDVTLGRYFRFGRSNRILGDLSAVSRSGERKRRKFSSTGERAPGYRLSPNYSKNSRACRLLIGHKKCFVLLCPIGEQFLLSSFREFVHNGYCFVTLARFVHQACATKGNFYFLLS